MPVVAVCDGTCISHPHPFPLSQRHASRPSVPRIHCPAPPPPSRECMHATHACWPAAAWGHVRQLWRWWDPPGKQRRRRYVYNDVGVNFALLAMHGRQAAFVFIDLDEFLMTPQPVTMAQVSGAASVRSACDG